ncbi:hypothetical protein E0Z10_g1236 [Xylaria hypoxylon]|uniref:Nephrocystin 3-like N-terminal domain-containing protein n=1 Tax=Xylaria hypoxylon TaxID=37992 RepID=A0A4Z0YUD3_9PEZI|nr:hypothetical protein E0Z10_g1236 [Xylaria hypoxylon]
MDLDSVNKTPAQGGDAGATTTKLFDDALKKLRSALSDADKAHIKDFHDHNDMIASVRKAASYFAGNQRGLMRIAERITAFSNAFAPFFDVVNVYIQIKPEWAAVFWDRLSQSLAMLYDDFVDFTVHVYFMFTKRSKGRLRRALQTSRLMLRPFDARFSLLKERIEKHRVWFETEAQIQQHDLLHQTYTDFRQFIDSSADDEETGARVATQRAENGRRAREMKSWINSSDYQSLYHHINTQMHPQCGKSVVQLPDYVRLKSLPFLDSNVTDPKPSTEWLQRLIFLKGKPGMGKTFLSVRIIDDLRTTVPPTEPGEERPNVVYFHYSQVDRYKDSSSIASFRAISEQLIHAHRGDQLTLDSLAMIQSEQGSGQHVASTTDVRAVVNILLRQHPTFIVIDGVDECNNPEALLEAVRDVCIDHDCRVILLGRPNTPIPRQWKVYTSENNWMVEIDSSSVSKDIACYLQDNLSHLIAEGVLGSGVKKLEHLLQLTEMNLISTLANAAEGIFLWVKVLLNLLQSPALSTAARLGILQKPTKLVSLDALYRRILDTLESSSVDEQELAQKVFQWLLFSAMALNTASLHTILAIHPGRPTTELDYLTEYPQCIPRITCALVELDASRDTFVFLHLSFKDFLLHKAHYNPRQNTMYSSFMRSPGLEFESWDEAIRKPKRQCPDANDLMNQRAFKKRDRSPRSLVPEYYSNSASSTLEYTQLIDSRRLEGRNILHRNIADVRSSQLALAETYKPFCGFGLEAVSDSLEASVIDAGMIRNRSKRQDINVQYPFLRYSALCWQHHLVIGHSEGSRMNPALSRTPELWITLLSQFLISRFTVTMWTEASYHYRMVPHMGRLNPLISQLMPSPTLPTRPNTDVKAREYAWVGIGLHQLSGALRHLADRFSNRLLQNPSLIWQEDIVRAEDKEFWPNWEEEEELKRMEVDGESPSQPGSWRFDYDVPPASSLA